MTKYDTLNAKLSNSQLSKLKLRIKNDTEVTLNLSSILIGNSNHETNLPHKLLLTAAHVSRIYKAFTNGSLANRNVFKKTPVPKMVQLGGSLTNELLLGLFSRARKIEPFISITDSYEKERNNTDTKDINSR